MSKFFSYIYCSFWAPPLISYYCYDPKRFVSKDTIESNIGEAVESTPMNFPIFSDIQLFIEKELDITWQKVNEVFLEKSFKADLEDWQVYINVQRSGLHKISCIYLFFPCADIISWTLSHMDNKTMILSNSNGKRLAYFMEPNYQLMYHFLMLESLMDYHFYAITNYLSTKDIVKIWVKEPSNSTKHLTTLSRTNILGRLIIAW